MQSDIAIKWHPLFAQDGEVMESARPSNSRHILWCSSRSRRQGTYHVIPCFETLNLPFGPGQWMQSALGEWMQCPMI